MDSRTVAGSLSTEIDLLAAARAGDEEAGRRLMQAHGSSMIRTAWNVLGRYGGNEAMDVVQEAFIAALTTPALPRGELGAWLRAITARKALDALRRIRRRGEHALEDAEGEAHEPASGEDPGTRLRVIAVREALLRLSPADRAVLTLVDLEGWSMAEAASSLGLTRVAVRLRAVRARRKLARWLRPVGAAGAPSPGRGRIS
jgi:RNA polymerase sigma-70 factor, ECF subfamily